MGSIGDTTESSKASSTVAAADEPIVGEPNDNEDLKNSAETVVAADEPIVDEPNDNEDLENSAEPVSDDELPPFPYAFRGKVVSPTAGNNLRTSIRSVRDAKPKEPKGK